MIDLRRPWTVLVAALAAHVADEAATGFLDFYNPLVRSVRSTAPWFPMPTFTFGVWLAGLIALIVVLAAMTPWITRGGTAAHIVAVIFSAIMTFNGLGHLAGSLYFARWLPGTTSAPFLLAASVWLARATLATADRTRRLSA